MTYYLKNEIIKRLRRRFFLTLTNVRIVRSIFDDLFFKRLYISQVINDYNHYMNDVDRSNQIRKNLTVHRTYECRV